MLETNRLKIIPLDYRQELKFLADDGSLESELGLTPISGNVPSPLKEVIEQAILPKFADAAADYFFFTTWIIVDKHLRAIVGSFGFKDLPDANGEIEIGYGTNPEYQSKGYQTEAIKELVGWANENSFIKSIIAETEQENYASIKVLQKNAFKEFRRHDEMILWRLDCEKL